MSSLLDQLIPTPRLTAIDHTELAAPPDRVWSSLRHDNLAGSRLVRALFALRTLPERLAGRDDSPRLRIDELRSTPDEPGFSLLLEDAPYELAVGAIGQVWHLVIPFVHVASASEFLDFHEPRQIKVAWAMRVLPLGANGSRVEIEVRVDATDDDAWHEFERYFKLIGPGSHLVRRILLHELQKRFGARDIAALEQRLPGDEFLPTAAGELTDDVTIEATPERVWPWLVQMGCRRGGFYSYDSLDNAGQPSAREVVPELQSLRVGDVIPASPHDPEGFEVLRIDAPHSLVLGGLYDVEADRQLPFAAPRPERYWQVTWAFMLEPLTERSCRLHVRARAAFPESERLHLTWIRPVHRFMQHEMLQQLAARAEGRLPRHDYRDLLDGARGAALMLGGLMTPFLRRQRSHWGVDEDESRAARPGDELVPEPDWSWTHGAEVQASAELVWHWVAQIGADRGGFYSYQWLENLAGCGLRNADAIHQEWELELGDDLLLHPLVPPLRIAKLERGRFLVAHAPRDESARAAGEPWVTSSWLFQLEPLTSGGCKVITRFRAACSADLATRLAFGPTLLEPIGFAMDRRMLLGIKQRAERQAHYALTINRARASGMPG